LRIEMAKIDPLDDVGSLANTTSARSVINNNAQKIEEAFANTLSRDGSGPNQMEADIDLNDHFLMNVADPVSEADAVNLRSVRPLVEEFASQIIETAVFGTQEVDVFTATPGQTDFPLSEPPGSIENVALFVDEGAKVPGVDFTLTGATLETLVVTPALAGGETVLVRYSRALPAGISQAQAVTYTPPLTSVPGTVKDYLDALQGSGGAALMRFLQSGAGAAARTVQDKLRDVISVKDFGAVGDDVADDTLAIQRAVDATPAYGELFFPNGKYRITSPIEMGDKCITIAGAGFLNTLIRCIGCDGLVITNTGAPPLDEAYTVTVRDIWFLTDNESDVSTVKAISISAPAPGGDGGQTQLSLQVENCRFTGIFSFDQWWPHGIYALNSPNILIDLPGAGQSV
jgi:hypothetical protein